MVDDLTTQEITVSGDLRIPLMRPSLPKAEELVKYLEAIDVARRYTNAGPLVTEFERRLARHFDVGDGCVVCVANGTLGLVLALAAGEPRPGSLCIVPSWTFVATPCAAVAAGLTPWFVDVREDTWCLDPDQVAALLPRAPGTVAAVVAVSPFGAPLDPAVWDAFRASTGIDVVLDMAAAFDSCKAGRVPALVSLHATKVFGVGEGGLVVTTDEELAGTIRRNANYGFSPGAQVTSLGINAKMSEYTAAVGLAALDRWPRQRAAYSALTRSYRTRLQEIPDCALSPAFGEGWCGSTCNVRFVWSDADRLRRELQRFGIESRKWWGNGCHRHPALAFFPRTPLPATEALSSSVLGLPFFPDLREEDVDYLFEALHAIRTAICGETRDLV